MSLDEAKQLLRLAGVFYEDDEEEGRVGQSVLDMNDTWGWATAWGEEIPEDKIVEVAKLFTDYGWPGLLYWMSERHEQMRSEFEDINRFVDFVRHEERLRKEEPNSSRRAYKKITYTLGTRAWWARWFR